MALNKLKVFAAAAVVAGAGMFLNAPSVAAATIGAYNDSDGIQRANVTCSSCSVLIYTANGTDAGGVGDANNVSEASAGSYGMGTSFGELFNNPFGLGAADEIDWVNDLFGTSYVAGDTNKEETVSDGTTYTSSAEYVLVKIGKTPRNTIIRNDSGGSFTFSWNPLSSVGAGFSHYTEFGEAMTPVPVPAAGLLLIGALGGLGMLRRRRKIS